MSLARNTAKMAVLVILILSIYVNQNTALYTNEVKFPITSLKSEVSPVEPKTLSQFCSSDEYSPSILDRFDAEGPQCKEKLNDEHHPQPKIHYREDAFKMPSICDNTEYIPEDRSFQVKRESINAFPITPYQISYLKSHSPSEKYAHRLRKDYDNRYYVIPHSQSISDNSEVNKEISLPQSWKYNEDTFKTNALTKDSSENTDLFHQKIPIKTPDIHSYIIQERPEQTIGKWFMNNPEEYILHPELRNLYYKPEHNTYKDKTYTLSYFPTTKDFIKINSNQQSLYLNENGRMNNRLANYSKLNIEKGNERQSLYLSPQLAPNICKEKNESVQELMVKNGPSVPFQLNLGKLDKIDVINEKNPMKHSLTSSVSAVENRLCNSNIKRIFQNVGEVGGDEHKLQSNNLNVQKIRNIKNEINDGKDKLNSSKFTISEKNQRKCHGLNDDYKINNEEAMQSSPWAVESNKCRFIYQNNIFDGIQSDEEQSKRLRSPLELTQSTLVSDNYNNYNIKPHVNKYNFGRKTLDYQQSLEENRDRNLNKLNECKIPEFHRPVPSNNHLLEKSPEIYNIRTSDLTTDDNHIGRTINPFDRCQKKMKIHTNNIKDTNDFSSSKECKLTYENPNVPHLYNVSQELKDFNAMLPTDDKNLKVNTPYINHEKKMNTVTNKNVIYTPSFSEIENLRKKENMNLSSNLKTSSCGTFKKSPDISNNTNIIYGTQPNPFTPNVCSNLGTQQNGYVQVSQVTENKNIPTTFTTTLDQVKHINSGIKKIQSVDISSQSPSHVDTQAMNNKEIQNVYFYSKGNNTSDKEYNNNSLDKSINIMKANPLNTDKINYIKHYTLPTSISSGNIVNQNTNNEHQKIYNNGAVNIIPQPIQPTNIQKPLLKPINIDNSPRVSTIPSYSAAQAPMDSFNKTKPKITVLNSHPKVETQKYQQEHPVPLVYYMPSPKNTQLLSHTGYITPNQNYTHLPNTIGAKTPQARNQGISTNPNYQNVIVPPNDKYTSLLSSSLNNIASVIVTNILSSLNTDISKALKKPIPNQEVLPKTIPSVLSGASTISAEIPLFELIHPCIESPKILPETSIKQECSNVMASDKLSTKPKPYISTITINVLPSVQQTTNDIIIIV